MFPKNYIYISMMNDSAKLFLRRKQLLLVVCFGLKGEVEFLERSGSSNNLLRDFTKI